MNILANVTYSLNGDYNEMVDMVYSRTNGDYLTFTKIEGSLDDYNLDEYDIIINMIEDDKDIMDNYHRLYEYANAKNGAINFIAYYKCLEYYTSKEAYYSKKDANKDRTHRFIEYEEIDEVLFDLMMHTDLHFGADINVYHGMLRYRDYDILDLGGIRYFVNNKKINEYYRQVVAAREEQEELSHDATLDNEQCILDLEEAKRYEDEIYSDYDRYLEYAITMYREILFTFRNKLVCDLDYIYAKEYFYIGHFTYIAGCFNRKAYEYLAEVDDSRFVETMSIYKMIVCAIAFNENINHFILSTLSKIFIIGKRMEMELGKDDFFFYSSHDFYLITGGKDDELDRYKQYLELIETKKLVPNNRNVYRAYHKVVSLYRKAGRIDEAIPYAIKALDYAPREIDTVKTARTLFEMYKVKADEAGEIKYVEMASKYSHLLLEGYHNEYAGVAVCIMNLNIPFDNDKTWRNNIIDNATSIRLLNKDCYYYLMMKRLFDLNYEMPLDERITTLSKMTDDMSENFYMRPTQMFVSVYNCLIVLGNLYEQNKKNKDANICYKRAFGYLSLLEKLDANIDEQLAYAQYKIGDYAIDMASRKSYKLLSEADKRIYAYILKTHKYVMFYVDVSLTINDRFFHDKRYKVGAMVSKNNLGKLLDLCKLNDKYFKDAVKYCAHMVKVYRKIGDKKNEEQFSQLIDNYIDICKEKNIEVERPTIK